MGRKNRASLADRVNKTAETILAAQNYVSPVDVIMGIGWLDPVAMERWRRGQIDCLEQAVQANPRRLSEAMRLLHSWAVARGLRVSETDYVARTPGPRTPRSNPDGDASIERLYRTHWIAPELSERKRERLEQQANRAPDLVVIQPLNTERTCHRRGATGDLLMMENPGPACLRCVGLEDLAFLPAGDALLSRRVKAKSARCAVVMRFSRSRRRYERQGLLVEPGVLADIECGLQRQQRTGSAGAPAT